MVLALTLYAVQKFNFRLGINYCSQTQQAHQCCLKMSGIPNVALYAMCKCL